MRNIYSVFLAVAIYVLMFLSSCKEQQDNYNSIFWGSTRQYPNFLFKIYEPVKMEQTLIFDFNEDAIERWNGVISFELIDINTKQKVDNIILYKNGEVCERNILNITKNDNEVVVGIEFLPDAPEGRYILALQPKKLSGIDRIDAVELEQGIIIEKEDVMNPLAKWTIWVLILVSMVLLAWFVIVHKFINPKTYFSKVDFDYGLGAGRPIRMGYAYKLVCTNKNKKNSFWKKLFWGNVKYEVNEFWDKDFVITNGVRYRQVRFEGRTHYQISSNTVNRGDSFTVTNTRGHHVHIRL